MGVTGQVLTNLDERGRTSRKGDVGRYLGLGEQEIPEEEVLRWTLQDIGGPGEKRDVTHIGEDIKSRT